MLQIKRTSSYLKIYKQICKELNVPLNNEIKNGLLDTEFFLRIDMITKQDIEPILFLLQQCKFKIIILQGGTEINETVRKLNRSMVHVSAQKHFSASLDFLRLFKAICLTMSMSLELVSFAVRDVRLTSEAIKQLSLGIQTTQSLKELEIKCCSLNTQYLGLISSAIQQNSSLMAINLSKNFLNDESGVMLQRILEEHSARRDRLEWVYKNRGETPEEDIGLGGICELNLSYNRFNTLFVKELAYFLGNDRWLKSINLRGNNIDESGLQILNQVLDSNKTLMNLDVRDNPGTTHILSKSIYVKLVRNMENLKEQNSLLANVSAIPKQESSLASNQNDQDSPMISFEQFKQISQSSKKETLNRTKVLNDDADVILNVQDLQSQCSQCSRYIQHIKREQQINKLLRQENQMLKLQMGRSINQEPLIQHLSFNQNSTSQVLNNIWQNDPQIQIFPPVDHEDTIIRIEQLMSELTRMMDSLEHQNSATNNNLTAHLSTSIFGPNNNTQLIYPRDQILMPEPHFMNILDGNNSNIIGQQQHHQDEHSDAYE